MQTLKIWLLVVVNLLMAEKLFAASFGIAIDTSGSMQEKGRAIAAAEGAQLVIEMLNDGDSVRIIGFHSDALVSPSYKMPVDRKAAKDFVKSFRPGGGTNYLSALRVPNLTGIDELIFLSDGEHNGSPDSVIELIRKQVKIPIHTISVGTRAASGAEKLLSTMSSLTKGTTVNVENSEELIQALVKFAARLNGYPTYLLLDEFQNFVGPDIEAALPEVRQLGLRLILSHQSLSQLKRGDHDLTSMIFQAQSRLIFGIQGEDADFLANELASLTYDSRKVKDEFLTRRQLIRGHGIIELESSSEMQGEQSQQGRSEGSTRTKSNAETRSHDTWTITSLNDGNSNADSSGRNESSGSSRARTSGIHQTLVPQYDEFFEISSRTYESFEEQRCQWASDVRQLLTG